MSEMITDLVSTIIPVHNRPGMIREAVESVLAQTYRPLEIIISDDGSTDDTPEQIGEMAEANPGIVRAVFHAKRGVGPAREAGRQLARGEFIQYLDSDDRLSPSKFQIQVKALRDHPECGVAYGFTRLQPVEGPPRETPYKWSGRALPSLFPWLLVDRWWTTNCPLYRRSVCDAVGPWTDLRYSQDWEYDGRVGALGTRLVHCREFVCEHRQHRERRQTGHGGWLPPSDRVRFLSLMYQHARKAGVSHDSLEMRHFSRWAFLNARQCGQMGDAEASRACLELAYQAAGGRGLDLSLYRVFAGAFGWRLSGKITSWLDTFPLRTPGRHTRRLSWMEE